ncbi:MAG: zinc ribbon domain-containing protein [Methanoregula sp.]|nr:zinc ribbon domain-containing protein [Methanoregula sp.]
MRVRPAKKTGPDADTITKVNGFHPDTSIHSHWIGVDLNTTGHAVVAADLFGKKILKLGKRQHYTRSASTKNCTKLYHEGNLWKIKKVKSREKKEFRAALHKIARQIVNFAESACAGIKFEKLFSHRYLLQHETKDSFEFSFENGSFATLLYLVEKRALNRGIPVVYVNPANTSKMCSRCGGFGRRVRKRFECPQCGRIIHADVNAALNIAATPCFPDKTELHQARAARNATRKLARERRDARKNFIRGIPEVPYSTELFSRWDPVPGIPNEA